MKTILLFVAIIVFASTGSFGQNYAFKVLVNKGQNKVKADGEWQSIKVGTILTSADELMIAPNGYAGLVHASGKPLEVKEAGPHKVADLVKKVKASTSVLNKYTEFLLSTTEEKPTNLNVTGSVTRGDEEIKLYLPDAKRAVVLQDEIIISWSRHEKAKSYTIQFNSLFGDELDRRELADTTINIDIGSGKLSNEDNILVKVFSTEDPQINSEEFSIKRLSAADRKRLSKELAEVRSLMDEKTAINHFYLGNFYEQNGLIIDAATSYQNAIRVAPDVRQFRSAFDRFVIRNGLGNSSFRK